MRSYHEKHKDRFRKQARERYLKSRETVLKDRKENPDKYKSIELKSNFGITLDEYRQMLDTQNGVCAICFQPETSRSVTPGKTRMLAVDHNHETGQVRGLLCSACNQGIGLFRDDPLKLESAITYLKERNG